MKFSKIADKVKADKAYEPSLTEGFKHLFEKGINAVNAREQKRDAKFFHISSIGYCLKSTYLNAKNGKETGISFLKKVNFGTKLHELYQEYLASSGHFYGNWYCKRCKTILPAGFAPGECGCGDDARIEYSELQLLNSRYKVSGHPDGFLRLKKPKITLQEIKTISPYRKIAEGPQNVDKYVPEHKRQCNFYLHIAQDPSTCIPNVDVDLFLAMLDTKRYVLVYHDKGSDETVPYEFEADKALFEKDLARVAEYHKCVKEGREPAPEPSPQQCRYCDWINACNGMGKKP